MSAEGFRFVITGSSFPPSELVCFLASEQSQFIDGVVRLIDGGSLAWRGTLDILGMGGSQ